MKNPEQFEEDAKIALQLLSEMGFDVSKITISKTGAGHFTNEYPGYFGLCISGPEMPDNHVGKGSQDRMTIKRALQRLFGKRNIRIYKTEQ